MAKNTHLEHLEDDILNQGSQGGFNAIAFLRELGKMLSRQTSGITITTKWDGAPAVICGTDPEKNKFFVGTKSVFAKTEPKLCYTQEDITRFSGSSELAEKLRTCLTYFPKLGIRGVLQGDLLFTTNKVYTNIGGENVIAFRPNTITYTVPMNSTFGNKIDSAKVGIVFHTSYSGPTVSEMSAGFGVDVSSLNEVPEVYVASASFTDASGAANFSQQQIVAYNAAVNRAEGSLRQASSFLDVLKQTGESKFLMTTLFKQFFNTYVRAGMALPSAKKVTDDFARYYISLLDKEVLSKKTKAAQDKYLKM